MYSKFSFFFIRSTMKGHIGGAFCLTEMSHGTNSKALRTMATYQVSRWPHKLVFLVCFFYIWFDKYSMKKYLKINKIIKFHICSQQLENSFFTLQILNLLNVGQVLKNVKTYVS